MIFDGTLFLSGAIGSNGQLSGQSVTGTGNVLGTNTIDLASLGLGGNQPVDAGGGERLNVAFNVLVAPTAGATVQFQLIQADDAALTTNVQVLTQTDAIPIASLPAGTMVPLSYNPGGAYPPKRYGGVRYVTAGGVVGMSVCAGIVKDLQFANKAMLFKNGFAVQ